MTFEILHQAKMLGDYTRFDLLTDRPLHTKTSITRPKDTLTRPKRTASCVRNILLYRSVSSVTSPQGGGATPPFNF